MDPVLTLILLLAIIASLLYFYFWIRSIARKVDRRGLDVRLEELEASVRETTSWLETASSQIREDLENRMTALKNMLDHAENTNVSSHSRADQAAPQPVDPSPAPAGLEPATETEPPASRGPTIAGTGIANQQPIDIPPAPTPSSTGLAAGPESSFDPASQPELPPAGSDTDLWSAPTDSPVTPPGEAIVQPEDVPPALDPTAPASAPPDDTPPEVVPPPVEPRPADQRAQILQLADQGVELTEIARQLNASRAEVELVVSFRRPR